MPTLTLPLVRWWAERRYAALQGRESGLQLQRTTQQNAVDATLDCIEDIHQQIAQFKQLLDNLAICEDEPQVKDHII